MRNKRVNAPRKVVVGLIALTVAAMNVATTVVASPPQCVEKGVSASRHVDYRFGGISESVLRVTVPVEKVRDAVPSRYRLLDEATGVATLIAAFGSVDELSVGCGAPSSAVVSEYGVMIDSPDGSPGRHAYYLWQLSDHRRLVNDMKMLGVPAFYAESTFEATTDAGGVVSIDAATEWQRVPNHMSATATEPGSAEPVALPGVRFWFDGPRGTVRVAYECPACQPRTTAVGSVSAAPGTTLDAMLGGTSRPGSGFFIRTDLEAAAQLLP